MYGIEIRKRVVALVKEGKSQREIANFLGICLRTIQGWCSKDKKGIDLTPNTHGPRHRKVDKEKLKRYVQDHPDATLEEIGKAFQVSINAIFKQLKTSKITLKKKTTLYKEGIKEAREDFQKIINGLDPERLVYIDETGVDNRLFRVYARALRGQKIHAYIPGKKRERISIIGALKAKQFIAPFTFTGGCNADVFDTWLEHVLLPLLPKNTIIVMDNAAFHKGKRTKEIIEKAGCILLFLPTYSPDFNPIEHWWHKIKSLLRPLVQTYAHNLQDIVDQCLATL